MKSIVNDYSVNTNSRLEISIATFSICLTLALCLVFESFRHNPITGIKMFLVDEVQQVECLPIQFDFKILLEVVSIFLAEKLCLACI